MANDLMKIEAPEYMLSMVKDNPELEGLMQELSAGTGGGAMYPQIKLKGTRFRIIDGDADQILKTTEINVAILRAKEKPERVFYVGAFNPDEERSPDCKSTNGVVPDADSVCKQNSSCEGCSQNAWGTGKAADGTPSKGKACKERKLIVVAPISPNGVITEKAFGLSIPPASISSYGSYISQLKLHGIKVPGMVITTIGFKEDSNFPTLTFSYGGTLALSEAGKAIKLMVSPEVASIINKETSAAPIFAPEKDTAVSEHAAAPAPEEADPVPDPAPAPEKPKRGRKPKSEDTAFGRADEPDSVQELSDAPDQPDPSEIAKALGIPFE